MQSLRTQRRHVLDALANLETERSQILEQFLTHDPGQDPRFRLTRRVAGKTVTESFRNPSALRKAQQEGTEFHRFQQLGETLVSINQRICQLRPVEREQGGWTDQEKSGCCNPYGNRARSKPLAGADFCGAPTPWSNRLGSRRNRFASRASPSRFRSPQRTAALPSAAQRSAPTAMPLRPSCPVSGAMLRTGAHRGRAGASGAALLPMCAMSSGTVSGRCGVGHRG